MKSKSTAAILALLLGGLGVHKFYLGKTGWGIVYLIFCWTFIPAIIALIECIILATMSEDKFNAKYNLPYMAMQKMAQAPAPVAVNITTDFKGRQTSATVTAAGWSKFTTTVAGFQHHDGPGIISQLVPGTRLTLVHEHDNAHDANAVKVMLDRYFLGYIPRDDAERVADAIDDEENVSGILKSYNPHEPDYHKLRIEVRRRA